MRKPGLTRRRFVTGAAAAFGFTFIPRRAFGANDRLNVAAVGVGGKGAGDVTDIAAAGANIVALCDVDERRAADTFAAFPQAKRYTDFRVLLDRQRDIDAVIVSTPDHVHAVASVAAMKLGKHVYCQKPLAHSVHEARWMAETARAQGVATQMGNQAHAGEPIRRAVEWVRAGVIGNVTEVHAWTNRPIWPQGIPTRPAAQTPPSALNWDLWLGPAPERDYNEAYVPFNWRGWWDFGTGALGDMACHILDMPYWALELGAPMSIEAQSEGGTGESPPWWSTIVYQFPARGARGAVQLTWYDGYHGLDRDRSPQNFPPADLLDGQDPQKWDVLLMGDRGKMFFNRASVDWLITPETLVKDFSPPPKSLPRVANEDAEWLAACQGGPAALSSFDYAGPFTETVLLGNVAIRAGKRIEWDAPRLVCPNAPEADAYLRREYRAGWTL